jgi:diketogulonate reductase-like aldo/keto reductase
VSGFPERFAKRALRLIYELDSTSHPERQIGAALESGFVAFAGEFRDGALSHGFRTILKLAQAAKIARADLFLEVSFSLDEAGGREDAVRRVQAALGGSLDELGTTYLDALILRLPSTVRRIGESERAAWSSMEEFVRSEKVRVLGVGNAEAEQLFDVHDSSSIAPEIVLNSCFAVADWDEAVREYCRMEQMAYQARALLNANPWILTDPQCSIRARDRGMTVNQLLIAYAVSELGIAATTAPLTSVEMKSELQACKLSLTLADREALERAAPSGPSP